MVDAPKDFEAVAVGIAELDGDMHAGAPVSLSAADPHNLVGILTPKPRLPALANNRLVWSDGVPLVPLAGV